MRLLIESLLLAALAILTIAKPIPMSDDEIQRRWHSGESEGTIHAAQSYRDATPAWPTIREAEMFTTDERTQALHKRETPMTGILLTKMKAFVANFYKSRGAKEMVAREASQDVEEEEAPVLKPRQYSYNFRG